MQIYLITNLNTNKQYVGQTKLSPERRLANHKKNASKKVNRYLYDSMNKHGHDKFIVELLEVVPDELANIREVFWIKEKQTKYPHGYNMTDGGGGGYTIACWTDEAKRALYSQQAKTRTGMKRDEKCRANMRLAAKRREGSKSSEDKQLISEKIRATLLEKGIKPPLRVAYGEEHPGYIDIKKEDLILLIKQGKSKKEIARIYQCTGSTIWSKIKVLFGEEYDFFKLRREYNADRGRRRTGPHESLECPEV